MKRAEITNEISQYKSEINRLLNNQKNSKEVGFCLANGKTPQLYWVESNSKRVLNPIITCGNSRELLQAVKIVYSTLKSL